MKPNHINVYIYYKLTQNNKIKLCFYTSHNSIFTMETNFWKHGSDYFKLKCTFFMKQDLEIPEGRGWELGFPSLGIILPPNYS